MISTSGRLVLLHTSVKGKGTISISYLEYYTYKLSKTSVCFDINKILLHVKNSSIRISLEDMPGTHYPKISYLLVIEGHALLVTKSLTSRSRDIYWTLSGVGWELERLFQLEYEESISAQRNVHFWCSISQIIFSLQALHISLTWSWTTI